MVSPRLCELCFPEGKTNTPLSKKFKPPFRAEEVKCNYSLAVAILSLQQILLVPLVLGHLLLRSAKIIRFVTSFQKIYDDRVHLVKMSLKEFFCSHL